MPVVALSVREQLFVEQTLLGKSAEKAAISAGYSERSARTIGPRLLRKVAVAEELERRRAQLAKKTETLQDRILARLEEIAFANLADFITIDADGEATVDLSKATREQLSVLNKVETKRRDVYTPKGDKIASEYNVKLNKEDSLRAIQLLGQNLGMFKAEEVTIKVDIADRLLSARQRYNKLAAPTEEAE